METITELYSTTESQILEHLRKNEISHRTKTSAGLWLGPLAGLSAAATIMKEDNSYSEICLLLGITGVGLIVGCLCLYARLIKKDVAVKDFHLLYFLPAIITSTLYLLVANKGLLVSVAWGLSVGALCTWGVIQIMSHFPHCFTLGEATVVTHGIVLFLLSVFTNLPLRYHLPPIHDNDIITVILQVGILFIGTLCILTAKLPKLREPINFYLTFVGLLVFVTIPVWHILLDRSPLLWIILFVFSTNQKISLILYWTLCLVCGTSVLLYKSFISNSKSDTAIRKAYHVLAVLVYIPGLMLEPVLLYLASGVVFALFIFLDVLRILKIPPFGNILQQGFDTFADSKDSTVSLTPLYLLSGLSLALWMPVEKMPLVVLMSGVLSIGIGDSCASYVGLHYGKHKWANQERTIEGTTACILSQISTLLLLALFGWIDMDWVLVKYMCAVTAVSMVEARTEQIDNLALPFLMYLCLLW